MEAASLPHGVRVTFERGAPAESLTPAAEPADLDAAPLAETQEAVPLELPAHSTRGAAPGPRGCWALNRRGEPCGAARRAAGDYCLAHSGGGVAANPAEWSKVGAARSAEVRRRRATLRLALGPTRLQTPKGLLRAAVFADAERVAAAALDGAVAPEVPVQSRAAHALKLIELVEPTVRAEVSMALPSTPEGVAELSLSQLLSIAEENGIALPSPAPMLLEQHGVEDEESAVLTPKE